MPPTEPTTPGRKANAAEPLGRRSGLVPERKADRIAAAEQRSAGPDGGDAKVIGDTFKSKPR
jgi:hypothetical protein